MFLLDSNVVSELRSTKRCHRAVRAWQQSISLDDCWISVITLLEIRRGISQIAAKDAPFAATLTHWLEQTVKPGFIDRTLPVTAGVAERAGRICAQRTRNLADCLIAATALEHRLTLATRNVADFEDLADLKIVNPWDA